MTIKLTKESVSIPSKIDTNLNSPAGLMHLSFYSSVFTLVIINVSRYWAINRPYQRQASVNTAKLSIAVSWTLSAVLVIPLGVVLTFDNQCHNCYESWNPTYRYCCTQFLQATRLLNNQPAFIR